ncbi:MAG: hypothetical protein UMU75_10215 [Halomonas sp.]|nr:hypothetical protein [Halomonas sp.]
MQLDTAHRWARRGLQTILLVEATLALFQARWLEATICLLTFLSLFFPLLLKYRFRLYLPSSLQLFVTSFIFATLYLGEVRGYYERYWWWDMLLHGLAGFLLGGIGFLVAHAANRAARINSLLKPGFVALFAFLLAVGSGAVWEIFEFGMDRLFGTNMQMAARGDLSGLNDTMWDSVMNAGGALLTSLSGWRYLRQGPVDERRQVHLLKDWIPAFIEDNPRLFRNR